MSVTVIYNPTAAGGRVGRQWASIERTLRAQWDDATFYGTQHCGHAITLAQRAVEQGETNVVSLGGDGTHNEVVNGIMQASPAAGTIGFGVLPAGTGGDFAKVLNTSKDIAHAASVIDIHNTTPLDVGRAAFGDEDVRYFVNVGTFGIGGLVDRLVNDAPKLLGGRASFFIGTVRALLQYKPATVRLRVDGEEIGPIAINTVAMGNGRYCGGGMLITPGADPTDGAFEVVIIEQKGVGEMLSLARDIYKGAHTERGWVHTRVARRVEAFLEGANPAYLDLDGEAPGVIPAEFTVVPGALRLLTPLR